MVRCVHRYKHFARLTTQKYLVFSTGICDLGHASVVSIYALLPLRDWYFSCVASLTSSVKSPTPTSLFALETAAMVGSLYVAVHTLWFLFSVPAYLLFLVLPLEAPTHRVAGAPPSHSGPTAGLSPRLFPRPLNISISQVGAGAHPVTAHPLFVPLSLTVLSLPVYKFPNFFLSPFYICLPLSLKSLHRSAFCPNFIYRSQQSRFFWREKEPISLVLLWKNIFMIIIAYYSFVLFEYFQTRGATSTENRPSTNNTVFFHSSSNVLMMDEYLKSNHMGPSLKHFPV